MTRHTRFGGMVLLGLLIGGCDDDDASAGRSSGSSPGSALAASDGGRAAGSGDLPCSLFSAREIADLLGTGGELRVLPLDDTCSWLDSDRRGVEIRLNTSVDGGILGTTCDGSEQRTLGTCGWGPDEGTEPLHGIGREAQAWIERPFSLDENDDGPGRWAAEAVVGNDLVTVVVTEGFGRDHAIRILRAAVDRLGASS